MYRNVYFHKFVNIPSLEFSCETEINSERFLLIIHSHKYIYIHRLLRHVTIDKESCLFSIHRVFGIFEMC